MQLKKTKKTHFFKPLVTTHFKQEVRRPLSRAAQTFLLVGPQRGLGLDRGGGAATDGWSVWVTQLIGGKNVSWDL